MADKPLQTHLASLESAPGGNQVVAYFDLDRTLIAGYSAVAFAYEAIRRGIGRGELAESVRILTDVLRRRSADKSTYHRLVKRLSKSLAGQSEETLTRIGEDAYRRSIARSVYREAITLVEAHRAAGHHLVMVTAASRYQAQPVAEVLGIEEVCCTRLEVIDGHFSGAVLAPLCHGEGKALAARRIARQLGTSLASCYFYSDSSDDLPLLKKVGHPVAVNASDKLAVHARARGWPQLDFNSRGRPGLDDLLRTGLSVNAIISTTVFGAVSKRFGAGNVVTANRMTRLLGDAVSGFAGLDFEIEGYDHLNRGGPAIFIFNHQSMLDSVVLAHLLRRDVVAFCKKELAHNPILGPLLQQTDTIFVDRGAPDQSATLKRAQQVLASGRSLVIAPEGTRSLHGDIGPFRKGAFLLAKRGKVPIVPIVLHNVKDALPKGAKVIRPAIIRITVLPPVYPEQMGPVGQLCRDLERAYTTLLGKSRVAALPYRYTA
jgi:putative phosphoserine phosphatase/1-acylglycerol-3-phosphate O-acyltransferase